MINETEIVPDYTIAAIPVLDLPFSELQKIVKPLNSTYKRDWFDKVFYKCLPLSIANRQGFSISVPFGFDLEWNGGNDIKDLSIYLHDDEKLYHDIDHLNIESHFGYGILTIGIPVVFKTPPGINLMTIPPPNYITPNLMPMFGVVETDNLRYTFTVNLKVVIPDIKIRVFANTPLAAFIPIPRNFCDSFELVDGKNIFSKDVVEKEQEIVREHGLVRSNLAQHGVWDKTYFSGTDIRGNKFKNHQIN
jgi:hypothetical protein